MDLQAALDNLEGIASMRLLQASALKLATWLRKPCMG